MTHKHFAIIENNIVTNIIVVGENFCATEEAGNTFVQSLGFAEGKDAERPESPTPANIGDQFNRELGRFQSDSAVPPDVIRRLVDKNNLALGWENDTTKEWFYNDSGRWEVRDVQEGV